MVKERTNVVAKKRSAGKVKSKMKAQREMRREMRREKQREKQFQADKRKQNFYNPSTFPKWLHRQRSGVKGNKI